MNGHVALPTEVPVFEYKNLKTGQAFYVWANGQVDGFPGRDGNPWVVINRIPELQRSLAHE